MMKSPYSQAQIDAILKQVEDGKAVRKVCCENNVSHVSVYRWRQKARNAAAAALHAAASPSNTPTHP